MSNIFAVLLVVIPALLNLGILIYLLFFLPKGKTTNIFTLFILALIAWQSLDTTARITDSEEVIQFWDRMVCIGWLSVGPLILHFVLRFTSKINRSTSRLLILLYSVFFVFYLLYVSNGTPVDFVYNDFWGWVSTPRPGTLDIIQRHCISLVVIAALFLLFRYVFQQKHDRRRRYQGLIIAIGILIPTIQGTVTQVIFPAYLGIEVPVTSSFMTLLSLAIIIALRKFQLFIVADSLNVEDVLANLKNVVIIISPSEEIIYYNSFAAETVGFYDEKAKHDLEMLFPSEGDELEKFRKEVFHPALSGIAVNNYETRFLSSENKNYYVLLSSELIENNGLIQGVLLIAHDITENKMYLKAIEEQNRRMREIAWTQSHVVRAPLARIMGLVDIISFPGLAEAERVEMLAMLQDVSNELDEVIRDVVKKTSEVGSEVKLPTTENPETTSEN